MTYPTCDNDCTRLGWKEATISSAAFDLHVSYPPNVDIDGSFDAFCHDEQEMININGWLIEHMELVQ